MEKFEVRFGTLEPVRFTERSDDGIEIDMYARVTGSVCVSSYDKEKYGDNDSLSLFLRNNVNVLLEKSFEYCERGGSVIQCDQSTFADAVEKVLKSIGVDGKVSIVNVIPAMGSFEDYKRIILRIDPLSDGSLPDPGRVPLFTGSQATANTSKIKTRYCAECGKKLDEGEVFCAGCGTKNEIFLT